MLLISMVFKMEYNQMNFAPPISMLISYDFVTIIMWIRETLFTQLIFCSYLFQPLSK